MPVWLQTLAGALLAICLIAAVTLLVTAAWAPARVLSWNADPQLHQRRSYLGIAIMVAAWIGITAVVWIGVKGALFWIPASWGWASQENGWTGLADWIAGMSGLVAGVGLMINTLESARMRVNEAKRSANPNTDSQR